MAKKGSLMSGNKPSAPSTAMKPGKGTATGMGHIAKNFPMPPKGR